MKASVAPIIRAFAAHQPPIRTLLVHTGQHYDPAMKDRLFADLDLPPLDPATDRAMICGSPGMLKDLNHVLEACGFHEGNTSRPGDFVIERAFAES